MQQLFDEIRKFHKWADEQEPQIGEWDSWYGEWEKIRILFGQFLNQTDCEQWGDEQFSEILYIIARDNEAEGLADLVAEQEHVLLFLAEKALTYYDIDTRWQLADRLQFCNQREEAERLLIRYVQDTEEYVNRRSLMALAAIQSKETESYCIRAWERDCYGEWQEYQRIAVLHALAGIQSDLLTQYINLAKEDGRKWLVQAALDIEA